MAIGKRSNKSKLRRLTLAASAHLSALVLAGFLGLSVSAHAESGGTEFVYIGLSDAVRNEAKDGELSAKAKAFYLHQLESAKGMTPSDKLEIVSYHATGNVMKLRVPAGQAASIAERLEKASLPFVKFIDVPKHQAGASSPETKTKASGLDTK